MPKKYQIFVSSTFRDLASERQDTIRSILDLGHIPAGMELFPATDSEQLSYIKKVIDECDYYVLIMGGRYGSLDAEGISFTEREYDYAVENGKVVLAFVHGDASNLPVGRSDTAPRLVQSLTDFRAKVMAGRLVREWMSRENLEALVVKSIARAVNDFPAIGWIRGDAAASEDLLSQINMFRTENEKLKAEIVKLKLDTVPKLSDLATLDESIEIRYTYKNPGTSRPSPGSRLTTWEGIVKNMVPNFYSPGTRQTLEFHLKQYISKELNGSYPNSINDLDLLKIESQLLALGFLRSYQANSVGGGVNSYLDATPTGRAKAMELLAVRSDPKK